MTESSLGDVGGFIFPDWSMISSGTVETITPLLVILIWLIAFGTLLFAGRQYRTGASAIRDVEELLAEVDGENLANKRNELHRAAEGKSAVARAAWQEFDETLVAENGTLYNTVSAEEFFHEMRFAPRLVGNRLLHAIPTSLTTLGLLGTFAGLTIGLKGLDLGSTADDLRVGIQGLVAGAALGFTASLWGVFMSLVVNIIERFMERKIVKRSRILQARIDRLFQMRSPEQSLSAIALHSAESEKALQVLHEKIGSALQESVARVGEHTERALRDAIQSSIAPVMENLADRAANQSADVFEAVSDRLTASFNEMGTTLASELKESADAMRSTIDYMSTQLARQADQHLSQMNTMQAAAALQLEELRTATATQLTQVTEATDRQIRLLDEALPRVIEGLDGAADRIGAATQGFGGVAAGLTEATTELRSTSAVLGQMLTDAVRSMDELAGKTSSAAAALSGQHETFETLLRTTLNASENLSTVSESLRGGFAGMSAAQRAFLEDLEQQLRKHTAEMAGWLTAYSDQVGAQTAHRMSEWNVQTESFTSRMLDVTQALSDAIDEMTARSVAEPATVPAR